MSSIKFDKIIVDLESLLKENKSILPAKCIAEIIIHTHSLRDKYISTQTSNLKGPGDNRVSCTILGEIGRMFDLKKVDKIYERIEALFGSEDPDTREAASRSLGSISIGNISHFFPKLLSLLKSNSGNDQISLLLLTSVKEVITNSNSEISEFEALIDILWEEAKNPDDVIRNVVAECFGKLFIHHGMDMCAVF